MSELEGTLEFEERVLCQLLGGDDPQIPMDPPEFMLTPHSMTNVEYNLWRSGIPYARRLHNGLDYDEFNINCLMTSLSTHVYA